MSDLKIFFDNLNCFFKDEDELVADVPATVHKNEDGEIEEVRIYIPDYDQFIYFDRKGQIKFINITEESERSKSTKKEKRGR